MLFRGFFFKIYAGEDMAQMKSIHKRRNGYMEDDGLAPSESTGGWMVYQRQDGKSEVTMHSYSGFVNIAPDLGFRFTVE
jgi:hypothetical protein